MQRRVRDFSHINSVVVSGISRITHTHMHTHKELSQSANNEICLEQHKHMQSCAEYLPKSARWIAVTGMKVISTDMNAVQYWHKELFKTFKLLDLDNCFNNCFNMA